MPSKTTEKAGTKKAAKKPAGKPNALQQPLQPSKELAALVVWEPVPCRGAMS